MTAEPLTLRVLLLRPGARVPTRATEASTGFDLYARLDSDLELSDSPTLVPTGIAIEAPAGSDIQVRPRSGLARLGVLSTFGTLDTDYRGEVQVTMYTVNPGIRYTVHDGDRIAQLVVGTHVPARFRVARRLSETARGDRGHGSTGR
ncbi:MAG: dUTP diphosphatase [Dehalococcoidia bacterium]